MKKKNNTNYILAIETTGKICGVVISDHSKVLYKSNLDLGLNHSITLFDNIKKGIDRFGIDPSLIRLIKVSSGPGSFTGIRIGIATALGISEPYNIPIEYVDTLDSLSYNSKLKASYTLSMIDARANRVYLGFYESKTHKKLIDDYIVKIDDLVTLLNKYFSDKKVLFALVGDGALKYKDCFSDSLNINYCIEETNFNLDAMSLLKATGIISKSPIINYMLASKAEREHNDKY